MKQCKCSNVLLLLILIIAFLIAVLCYAVTIAVLLKLPDIIELIRNTTRMIEIANVNVVVLLEKINEVRK